jgi:hypothetical protein
MSSKLSISLFTVIAALSIGSAYAAGDKAADKAQSPDATAAPGAQAQKPLTKEEAAKQGISAEVFNKADLNKDGQPGSAGNQRLLAANPK